MADDLKVFEQFYLGTGIPIHVYQETDMSFLMKAGDFSVCDPVESTDFLQSLPIHTLFEGKQILAQYEQDVVCTAVFRDKKGKLVLMGPICLYSRSTLVTNRFVRDHHLNKDYLLPYIGRIQFNALVPMLYSLITGDPYDGDELDSFIPKESKLDYKENDYRVQSYVMNREDQARTRFTYEEEQQKMLKVENGDVEGIRNEMTPEKIQHALDRIGQMAKLPIKQWEYTVVSSVTKCAEAAIRGGVSVESAYSLADTLLQHLSECDNMKNIMELQGEVRFQFATLVRNMHDQSSNRSYVEKAKDYMNMHLNTAITLDDIADAVGVTKYYLCRKFKEAENRTPAEYLREKRVRAAQNMLQYSDYPITFISEYLQFNSQSHFGSVFLKYTGYTPHQYRSMHK